MIIRNLVTVLQVIFLCLCKCIYYIWSSNFCYLYQPTYQDHLLLDDSETLFFIKANGEENKSSHKMKFGDFFISSRTMEGEDFNQALPEDWLHS